MGCSQAHQKSRSEGGRRTTTLHPDHLADLHRSGLSDETINLMGCYTARPADIPKLVGWNPEKVESALVFPYPGCNGFCRIKVSPPFKDKNGHTVKYLQKKGTTPHLYILPPIQKILNDPSEALIISEGEKKAARGVQDGLPVIGIGGLWNWIKKGTYKGIPDLDRIAWEIRVITIVPDSDTWSDPDTKKRIHCQHAVYALGKELERRWAVVTFLVLPQEGEEKVGLDDFLIRHPKGDLSTLTRLTLEDEPLSKHQGWYESWKQRKEEEQTSRQETKQAIRIETLGDLWLKDLPARESFLGDGLIARGDLIVFSGPQKKGKSLASLNQALCLARGKPWLDFSVLKSIRVGIMQQEIPEGALKERLQKMLGSEVDPSFLSLIPHCSRQGLKLDTKAGLDFLRRWLDEAKIDLLQLDPLYTFHSGDENSAKDMGRFFSPLQQIIRDYSIAVEIIHHHGKPSQVEREGGDLHRGTSLLRDVTDANWTFTRVPANKLALNEPPSKYVYMSFEQRHSASPDPLLLHLDPETLWLERVEAKAVQEVRAEEVVEEIVQRGGEALQEDLIKAMHEKLDARERSTRDAIYKARDEGLIEPRLRGHKRTWKIKQEVGKDVGEEPCQSAI